MTTYNAGKDTRADHESNKITVTITGRSNTGKTTLAAMIVKTLCKEGLVDVDVECMDGDLADKIARNVSFSKVGKPNPKVVIVDNNGQ